MEPLFFLLKSAMDPPILGDAFTVKPTFTCKKKNGISNYPIPMYLSPSYLNFTSVVILVFARFTF